MINDGGGGKRGECYCRGGLGRGVCFVDRLVLFEFAEGLGGLGLSYLVLEGRWILWYSMVGGGKGEG